MFPGNDRTKPSTISLKFLSRKWFQIGFRAVARANEANLGEILWGGLLVLAAGGGRSQSRSRRLRLTAGWAGSDSGPRRWRGFQGRGQGREERHVSSGPVGFASSGCPAGLWWLVRSGERRPGEGGGV
jgi:hypothetical protein